MKHLNLTPALYQYMLDVSLHEHPVLLELRQQAEKHELYGMQIPPEQAQFMQFLIRLLRCKRVLELGTFLGYSALAMALALPSDGQLITCDMNKDWTKDAPFFWKKAGQEKIDLRLGPALDTLHQLINDGEQNKFDFIFIDADKTNYVKYYELALTLLNPHGLIVIDNVFWEGQVTDPFDDGAQVREIRKLNQRIKNDARVYSSLLPVADGLFLVQLKEPDSRFAVPKVSC